MADQYMQMDVRSSLLRGLHSLSGQAEPEERFRPAREPGPPPQLPSAKRPEWITEEESGFFVAEFQRNGFTGPLNYYRNMDRNWELTPFLDGAKILQHAIYIAGDRDPVLDFHREEQETLEMNVPSLISKTLLDRMVMAAKERSPRTGNPNAPGRRRTP